MILLDDGNPVLALSPFEKLGPAIGTGFYNDSE